MATSECIHYTFPERIVLRQTVERQCCRCGLELPEEQSVLRRVYVVDYLFYQDFQCYPDCPRGSR